MELYALPDGGIERPFLCGGLLDLNPSLPPKPFAALLNILRVALLSHGHLGLQCELPQEDFDPLQPFVGLDRQMKGLASQFFVAGVEESDHGLRLAEVAPRRLNDIVLPSCLVGSGLRNAAALSKRHGPMAARIGGRFLDSRRTQVAAPS